MDEEQVACPDPNEPVTRRILQEELSKSATKEDSAKLDTKVETYFGALHERLLIIERTLATVVAMVQALPAEIARQIRAIDEGLRSNVKVIDEKYADLPGRVAALEADHAEK